MDSDCLVKLTKSGAKEAVLQAFRVFIPTAVKNETVVEGKRLGFEDAYTIEKNIKRKLLRAIQVPRSKLKPFPATKGEVAVLSVYMRGGFGAVASDDRKFLGRLEAVNIPYLTPAACVLYLFLTGSKSKPETLILLGKLRAWVSREEYEIAKFYLEGKP